MTPGRKLLIEITGDTDLVSAISDVHPLALSGVNSGDLVRVMLTLEERLGRPLSAAQAEGLTTIKSIDELLAESDPETVPSSRDR